MSSYDQNSELSRFNRIRTTDWVPASASLLAVLKTALEIGSQSQGAFDITVGPLVTLWGFGHGLPVLFIIIERDGHFEERVSFALQRYRRQEIS